MSKHSRYVVGPRPKVPPREFRQQRRAQRLAAQRAATVAAIHAVHRAGGAR